MIEERPENDWRWQWEHRLTSLEALRERFPEFQPDSRSEAVVRRFPFAVTPYYAGLIRSPDFSDPIFRMIVPGPEELEVDAAFSADPLKEVAQSPLPDLIRRYEDRAVIIATSHCAAYCRHCDRKRFAGRGAADGLSGERLLAVRDYLSAHPEIRDAIVSGGDPLTLPTATLVQILKTSREVPSVEILRIGSRVPVTMPQRITTELTDALKTFHPLYLNTQFNHPVELTARAAEACARLADAGIPLGNQTVLLKGVNDDERILEALFNGLRRIRVRPYYLFLCEPVSGNRHFSVSEQRAVALFRALRKRLSGSALPALVKDTADQGKIHLV